MKDEHRICISSPPDREKLVAEVFIGDTQWAEINQERGALEVEFYSRPDGEPWRMDCEAALDMLNEAKQRLRARLSAPPLAGADPIEVLRGRCLSSVELVQDYIQLRFDGVCLTINAPLVVTVAGTAYASLSPAYGNILRERIASVVREARSVEGEEMVLEMEDGARIEISLRDHDQVSPEAVVMTGESDRTVIW